MEKTIYDEINIILGGDKQKIYGYSLEEDISAILILDKNLNEEDIDKTKKLICGISANDVEIIKSLSKEEIEIILKIAKIKSLKEELKKLEGEII